MKYLLIIFAVWAVNQLVKFSFLSFRQRRLPKNRWLWIFIWVGSFPSAYAAVLTSAVYLVALTTGFGAIFAFSVLVSILFIYSLLEDKKRQSIYEEYFTKSSEPSLLRIVQEQVLMDFSGHTLLDVTAGIVLGILLTFIGTHFIGL